MVGNLATVRKWFQTLAIDVCLFNFLYGRRLFFKVFLFRLCNAQLIGNWLEKRRGVPNTIILLIIRQC
jgi:hypothetical protein